jgi:hypothetical protein
MSSVLESLSPPQREIYDLLLAGKSPAEVGRKLGKDAQIVNAQITRIKNKGIPVPGDGTTNTPVVPADQFTGGAGGQFVGGSQSEPAHPMTLNPGTDLNPGLSTTRPTPTGASSNDQIARELTGKAVSADELAALARKVGGNAIKDIHPMLLMGIVIQFVRTCGGRMSAHQVIEDVYSALRGFANDGKPVPGDDGEAKPLPQTDQDRIKFLEEQVEGLREELQKTRSGGRTGNSYGSGF